MSSRAFTLLELLIVLALMALLSALVIPVTIDYLSGRAWAETPVRIEAVISSARASAEREGFVCRVVFALGEDGNGRLRVDRRAAVDAAQPDEEPTRDAEADWSTVRGIDGSLPRGILLQRAGEGSEPGESDPERRETELSEQNLIIAIITPDGVVRTPEALEIVAPSGTIASVTLSGLTGRVSVTRRDPSDAFAPDAAESEDLGPVMEELR